MFLFAFVFFSLFLPFLTYQLAKASLQFTQPAKLTKSEPALAPLEQAIKLLIEHGEILPPHANGMVHWRSIGLNGKEVILTSSLIFYCTSEKGYSESKYQTSSPELIEAFKARLAREEALKFKQLAADLLKELSK